jgi:hypothetical protein
MLQGTPVAAVDGNLTWRPSMTSRYHRFSLSFVGAMLALSACQSSEDGGSPSSVPDAQVAPDTRDGPSTDVAMPIDVADLLDVGAPLNPIDSGTVSHDAAKDRHTFSIPDGRQFTMVDYCLPVLPLSSQSGGCPADLDEAIAVARAARDASPASMGGCAEGWVYYWPQGPTLGWASACYYDTQSRQLVSVLSGSDTPSECIRSPEPNTAAFIANVYGRPVTCSYVPTVGFDAGGVD